MEAILSWVKSGLLFAVLASVILLLCPNRTYVKHVSLVVGLLFILVMIHPVMEAFHLDDKTYISYIENLLLLEGTQAEISGEQIAMYEESVVLQLTATLNENGYPVEEVKIEADTTGNIEEVRLSFGGEVGSIESLESYIKNLFGTEVDIHYEY